MSNNIKPLKSALSKTYAIERELGAGGMATVYLAEDVKHRRKVAVKVLHPALAETMPTIPGRYGRRTDKRSCFRKPMQPVLAFGSFRILVAPLPDRYSTRRPTNSTRHCRPTVNGWLTFLTKVVMTRYGWPLPWTWSGSAGVGWGGWGPVWAPSCGEIYYKWPAGTAYRTRMMGVTFRPGTPPTLGEPRVLFEGDYWQEAPFGRNYDIHPDGQRFLMFMSPLNLPASNEIGVVLNWFEELEASVGN